RLLHANGLPFEVVPGKLPLQRLPERAVGNERQGRQIAWLCRRAFLDDTRRGHQQLSKTSNSPGLQVRVLEPADADRKVDLIRDEVDLGIGQQQVDAA